TAALASAAAEIWMHRENNKAAVEAALLAGRLFGMPPDIFQEKLREITLALPEATARLDIDIGGEEHVNQLFEQARETLLNLTLQMQQQNRNLRNLSNKDPLTGIANRAFLDQRLPAMFEQSAASGRPLSVIFSDLDHFKKINDSYGHGVGDLVLIAVAGLMGSLLREDDVMARYGGEEFLCLLPDADEGIAAIVAERLRKAIAAQPVKLDDGRFIPVSISLGCVTMSAHHPFNSVQELLAAADRCLYAAKKAGRNRVVCCEPVESDTA
ncbi:MAG TPA: GGDEF domain-containing protein, partial [Acidobacteriota bacterium]|nr:GGDEF domain-containing protein [Acidobacteriota bacterium]